MAPRSSDTRPILCAVLDAGALGADPRESAGSLFEAGVDWIQLRDRAVEADVLMHVTRAVVEARDVANAGAREHRVLVNRRLDIAHAAGADGAHLGFDALDPKTAAAFLPDSALIGASVHSVEEIALVCTLLDGVAGGYAHLAPIWAPLSKPASRPALGLEVLSKACALTIPVLAQGGIDPGRAGEAIRAGAGGVAVTGILAAGSGRIDMARQLRTALDG